MHSEVTTERATRSSEVEAAAPPGPSPREDKPSELRCPAFGQGVSLGVARVPGLIEASGLAASRRQPHVLWVHNDSGDRPRVFAMSEQGQYLGTVVLRGAEAVDWEDIGLDLGAERDALLVADTGDNNEQRATVTIYRFPEPLVSDLDPRQVVETTAAAVTVKYPDRPHDAEAIFSDPLTGDIVIITKERAGPSLVFTLPRRVFDFGQETAAATQVAAFDIEGVLPGARLATAADISPDGLRLLVRTYTGAHLWMRRPGEALGAVFAREPCAVPTMLEPQGESVAFVKGGRGYLTLSEGQEQPIWFFQETNDASTSR